jgi:hypothetical protein
MLRFLARAVLPVVLIAPLALAQGRYSEGGYAAKHSVAAGESLAFHIATSSTPFNLEIINMASPFTVVQTVSGLVSQARDCTGKWETGCDWPVTTTFDVPSTFTPGYYAARFPTSLGDRHILFVVRAAVPGTYAPIVVIQPSNSDVAYNRFGGKSVYDTISDDGRRAHIVSFHRPYDEDAGFARYRIWERRFVEWMKAEGRKFEVITDDDMEGGISLAGYKAVIIAGHSEYWSLNARRHLENYSRSGGHIAVFGANTMWWQVRVDLQTRQMTVYKDASLDPLTGIDNDVVTTNFTDWPVLNPENTILGASFLNAAYVNRTPTGKVPVEERVPYTVRKADHWIFNGTGVTNGAQIGRSIAAIEVDGALFNTLPSGEVEVEGSDGTPLSYEILATLPASDGYATIGMYVNAQGGAVFNGAARDWTYGLAGDPVIQQMTRNVLDRLSTGEPFDYRPRATPNRAEDRFNTPESSPNNLPGWRFPKLGFSVTARCAREGQSGVELTGPRWTLVMRHLPVGRDGLTKGAANLLLNADLLESTPSFATSLLNFINYEGTQRTNVAALEILRRPEGRSVRVSSFSGGDSASTNWIVLPPGWSSVQFSWETGGMLELNVGGTRVSAPNPFAGQHMNALMLEFAGSVATGSVCVDHLQFRDAFAPASAATSTLTVSHEKLGANGVSKAQVLVRVVDANGNPLVNGGDAVTIATTLGTLSPVSDVGNGMYAAYLTAPLTPGIATIQATVNGQLVPQTATVTFEPRVAPGRKRRAAGF